MTGQNKLGIKVQTLREAHGLSVEELAERCDLDAQVIVSIESGEAASSLAPLIKITRALGVRLGTLTDDDEQLGPAYTDADDDSDDGGCGAEIIDVEGQNRVGHVHGHALQEVHDHEDDERDAPDSFPI